jgi:hypothetical protein
MKKTKKQNDTPGFEFSHICKICKEEIFPFQTLSEDEFITSIIKNIDFFSRFSSRFSSLFFCLVFRLVFVSFSSRLRLVFPLVFHLASQLLAEKGIDCEKEGQLTHEVDGAVFRIKSCLAEAKAQLEPVKNSSRPLSHIASHKSTSSRPPLPSYVGTRSARSRANSPRKEERLHRYSRNPDSRRTSSLRSGTNRSQSKDGSYVSRSSSQRSSRSSSSRSKERRKKERRKYIFNNFILRGVHNCQDGHPTARN